MKSGLASTGLSSSCQCVNIDLGPALDLSQGIRVACIPSEDGLAPSQRIPAAVRLLLSKDVVLPVPLSWRHFQQADNLNSISLIVHVKRLAKELMVNGVLA